MTNNIDPDKTVHNEPSHQDLQRLHRYLFWSAELKGLSEVIYFIWLKLDSCAHCYKFIIKK